MAYKMTDERWNSVKHYLDRVFKNPGKYPDEGILLSLSDDEITRVFTKKRLELVRLIQAKKPKNATKLSELTGRQLSAVLRDLKLLEKFRIIELEKKGKNILPKVTKEILILPLVNLKPKKLAEIKAIA
ncbi:MAG: hypothetical protein HY392_02935 [Candidatus Diapherotrites archaeon]|nr:hypothetical protein [Candidatus Diapherotrites archaeon]